MKWKVAINIVVGAEKNFAVTVLLSFLLLGGCATSDFKTHYGIFTAENSAGELRQFRVYWQTIRYQGWLKNTFRAAPLVLETQCSKRELHFYDASFGKTRRCSNASQVGIQFCSRSDLDVDRRGLAVKDNILCATITDRAGSTDILSLNGELLLTLNCRPKMTELIEKGKKINTDYLVSSEIPYVVSTKQVQGEEIDLLIPALSSHSSICDLDL